MTENALNIIILDTNEEVIKWLNPEITEVIETSTIDTCRKIEITYPLEDEDLSDRNPWYSQGNKVFIPSVNGITDCLYIINTDYNIDYWDKNYVKFVAEEVLTELNYNVIGFIDTLATSDKSLKTDEWKDNYDDEDTRFGNETQIIKYNTRITINENFLKAVFGNYYDIYSIDNLSKTKINPTGTMTYMSLLRLIEEKTGFVFITHYLLLDNQVIRRLSLKNYNNIRQVAFTEYLDLNYNLDSLELEVSEENVYDAMGVIFNDNSATNGEFTSGTGTSTTIETDTTTNEETLPDIIQKWLDYEVEYRQEIPLIISKDESGNLVTAETWYAPFTKQKGCNYIEYIESDINYRTVHQYDGSAILKMGTVETSETIPEIIYNRLAESLLDKINPHYEIKIDVKDIQLLLGLNNLGYNIYETLYIRIPNFNYFVPCMITETVKNLHLPGENSIKIETDVKSLRYKQNTQIITNNIILPESDQTDTFGGTLTTPTETLPNKTVTINITLVEHYDEKTTSQNSTIIQEIQPFNPFTQEYTFSRTEIERVSNILRNVKINKSNLESNYAMRDINGILYSVPRVWVVTLYHTYISEYLITQKNAYTNSNNTNVKGGVYPESITLAYYADNENLITEPTNYQKERKYYPSWYYDMMTNLYKELAEIDTSLSTENSNAFLDMFGVTPFQLSDDPSDLGQVYMPLFTEYMFNFIPPFTENVMNLYRLVSWYKSKGFSSEELSLSKDVIREKLNDNNNMILTMIDCNYVNHPYYTDHDKINNSIRRIMISGWFIKGGNLFLIFQDAQIPNFIPTSNDPIKISYAMDANMLLNAVCFRKNGDTEYFHANLENGEHYDLGLLLSNTKSNLAKVEELQTVNFNGVNLDLKNYTFHSSKIQEAIDEVYEYYFENNGTMDIEALEAICYDTQNTGYKLNMKQLRALAYTYMHYFRTNTNSTANGVNVLYSKEGYAYKYENHFRTSYDWFTPCYPEHKEFVSNYMISTALFNLGFLNRFSTFYDGNPSNNSNLNSISNEISKYAGNKVSMTLYYANSTHLPKVGNQDRTKFMQQVAITYIKDDSLALSSINSLTVYPVLVFSCHDDEVHYQNLNGNGNSPTYNYNKTVTDAGKEAPWYKTSLTNFVDMVNNAKPYTPSGDRGLMLMIKRTN